MSKPYEPTTEEIAEATAKIREGWDEEEHIRRVARPEERPRPVVVRRVGVDRGISPPGDDDVNSVYKD